MHDFLAQFIVFLNSQCLSLAPSQSHYDQLYKAMVCGTKLPLTSVVQDFKNVGLYHLLVVSGSHLVFFETLIGPFLTRFNKKGEIVICILLFLFSLTCGLMPPVTRALISFMLRKVNDEARLFWPPATLVFFSGLLTLMLFPSWLTSTSFILSWSAAFCIAISGQSGFLSHLVIYLGLLPILASLQFPHPFTALINFFFAPILGLFLFPLCLLTFIISPLSAFTDLVWNLILLITSIFSNFLTIETSPIPQSALANWLYILAMHYAAYKIRVQHIQSKLKKCQNS